MAGQGHGHSHTHASAGMRHRGRLAVALVLAASFAGVEFVTGVVTGSLGLISDAGHMVTDALGLGMALAAVTAAASARPNPQRSFGLYRLEILAALVNTVLLLGVCAYVLIEAVQRLAEPTSHAPGAAMMLVAAGGLVVNLVAFALLRQGASESLNVRGAYLEVVADAVSSVGVLLAGVIVVVTGWSFVDPLVALGIAAFIAPRAWGLGRESLRILLQTAPVHVPVEQVHAGLAAVQGVLEVHDLHVWTLTSGMEVVSAHLVVDPRAAGHATLDRASKVLSQDYGLEHVTLQLEPRDHAGCETIACASVVVHPC